MDSVLTCGAGEDVWMPHPDHLVHSPCGNDVGFGTVIEAIHTFVYRYTSHLTVTYTIYHQVQTVSVLKQNCAQYKSVSAGAFILYIA